jgi:hypothetical protein
MVRIHLAPLITVGDNTASASVTPTFDRRRLTFIYCQRAERLSSHDSFFLVDIVCVPDLSVVGGTVFFEMG